MVKAQKCPSCGTPLPADAPAGICPACLLKSAAAADSTSTLRIGPEAFAAVRHFGDYELLEEIARGGMGVVWKARQTSLNRVVALKMILAGALAGEEEVRRFRREAEAAANLQHPNIVAIHQVGQQDGQHFYTMDFVQGRNLSMMVGESGPFAGERAASCVKSLAEAVHFAHQRGTLHRDLKPQNVLVDESGVARITDFGLAKFTEREDSLTMTGDVMGSPSYMPPEQAAGRLDQIGPTSDVYALGAILYELLTGRPPFRGESAVDTIRQVMETEPVPPRKIISTIPLDLQTVCLKCLEKNPARRYHSAQALAEDLDRFLKHQPIQAVPASSIRKWESWIRRHPWPLMAGLSLIALMLAGMLYWQHERVLFLEEHPTLDARAGLKPGPLTSTVNQTEQRLIPLYLLTMFCIILMRPVARRGWLWRTIVWTPDILRRKKHWKDLLNPPAHAYSSMPLSQPVRLGCALIGLATLVLSIILIAETIKADVWEGHFNVPNSAFAYANVVCSAMLLYRVGRDYQKFVHGSPLGVLTPGQHTLLREAVFQGDLVEASKIYQKAFPDLSRDEAADLVMGLSAELKKKEAEKFAKPPRFWGLNLMPMGFCLLAELCIVEAFNFTPVFHKSPFARLLVIAMGYAIGATLMFTMRVKNFRARLAAMLSFLLSGAFSVHTFYFGALFFVGALGGAVLIMSGFMRKSR